MQCTQQCAWFYKRCVGWFVGLSVGYGLQGARNLWWSTLLILICFRDQQSSKMAKTCKKVANMALFEGKIAATNTELYTQINTITNASAKANTTESLTACSRRDGERNGKEDDGKRHRLCDGVWQWQLQLQTLLPWRFMVTKCFWCFALCSRWICGR